MGYNALMTTHTTTRFAAWRCASGLTQQAAAELLGVSKSIVIDWEAGVVRGRGTTIEPPAAVWILIGVARVHGRVPHSYSAPRHQAFADLSLATRVAMGVLFVHGRIPVEYARGA